MQSTLLEFQLAFTGNETRRKRVGRILDTRMSVKEKPAPAEAAFEMLLRGKTVSKELQTALHRLFVPTLTKAYANGGMQNSDWRLWLRAMRDIIESIQPELLLQSTETRKRAIRQGCSAIRMLSRQPVKQNGHIASVGKLLKQSYRNLQEGENESAKAVAASPRKNAVADATDNQPTGSRRQSIQQKEVAHQEPVELPEEHPDSSEVLAILSDSFKPGLWFKLHRNGSNSARWLKVASYDADSRTITFANREGKAVDCRDAITFMRDLAQGKAELVHDADSFEKNLERVIAVTQQH